MKKEPKVAIGYVHNGSVDQPWMDSVFNFLAFDSQNRKITLGMGHTKGLYVDDNRNELVRDFLKTPADFLLSLDTDMGFAPDVPYRLLDEAMRNDRPILSALYFSFIIDGKLRPVWFVEGKTPRSVANAGNFKIGDVVPLAAVGAGCCLIRRDVFEKIAEVPEYAKDTWTWYGREPFMWKELLHHHGEDINFCFRAKDLGFTVWGDSNVMVDHWKKMKVNFDLFRLYYGDAQRRGVEY